MAWAPPATTKASTWRRPAAASRTALVSPSRSAGEATDDPPDAGDPGRDDRHHERRGIRRGPAGDVGAHAGKGGPAALDLDAGGDRRAGRGRRSLGLGEAADVVDRLIERTPDARLEALEGVAQVVRIEDQAAVAATAPDRLVRGTDRGIAAGADLGEGRPGRGPDRRVGHGPAPDEGVVVARSAGSPAATAGDRADAGGTARSGRRGRDGSWRATLMGRSSRWGRPGCPTRRPP